MEGTAPLMESSKSTSTSERIPISGCHSSILALEFVYRQLAYYGLKVHLSIRFSASCSLCVATSTSFPVDMITVSSANVPTIQSESTGKSLVYSKILAFRSIELNSFSNSFPITGNSDIGLYELASLLILNVFYGCSSPQLQHFGCWALSIIHSTDSCLPAHLTHLGSFEQFFKGKSLKLFTTLIIIGGGRCIFIAGVNLP
ncbi:hypothetical protein FF38_01118 [Lucilia cuprina]|uniref:Uncharacterized protein n=1 Tax=Lucilia cuprina TaxID=7375 RepID=A0A0L0C4T0_LUCCU|nr:hypothetical protein FF38_01118 [Lucilia cuprina]